MSEVVVVARARVQPGREDEMLHALQANAEVSRKEDGCVSYNVLRGDAGLFMTIERWRSSADVERHMATPHVQTLLGSIAPLLAEPPVIESAVEV
jgi:quinol monooxygenase YgiN